MGTKLRQSFVRERWWSAVGRCVALTNSLVIRRGMADISRGMADKVATFTHRGSTHVTRGAV